MITKTILWTRQDGGLSITYVDSSDNYDEIVKKQITNFGGSINHVLDGEVKKPATREHRDCWILEPGEKKIKVCPVKLSVKLKKISDEENAKKAIKDRLGLSDDDVNKLKKLLLDK